uniref:Uncharacterized protein n=1 Tax=Tetranychus urticae TaxID=32264 RepID=T1KIB1_TETUR
MKLGFLVSPLSMGLPLTDFRVSDPSRDFDLTHCSY